MRFRAPVPQDAQGVLAVLVARDIADLGAPDYRLEDLHDEWRGADFDLDRDALVAETEDGLIVGYASVVGPGIHVDVAPDHEGRGIGLRLLRWAERRERQRGRERHRQWVAESNARGAALLLAAGYQPVRSYWRLVRQLDDVAAGGALDDVAAGGRLDDVAAGAAPAADVSLRALDVDADATVVHALNEASFAGNPDYRPETFDAFTEEHLRAHDLDPELSLVAEQGDIAVGFLLARRWQDDRVGFVDLLGVHPDYQSRGLATSMLRAAFTLFATAGLREAQLGVASDNPRALGLYERCGMTSRFRHDAYERPASSASS